MRLNEKTLDPVGGALWYLIDTGIHHILYDHLNQFNKISLCCELNWREKIKTEYIKM